jgi:transposase
MLAFIDIESRIPLDHPLRTIKYVADEALAELSPLFDEMYVDRGRPSIAPERLLKAPDEPVFDSQRAGLL